MRFDVPVFALDRQVRACSPEPGAWCLYRQGDDPQDKQTGLTVLRAAPARGDEPGLPEHLEPGRLAMDRRHLWVGTKTLPLELQMVKAAGKRAMKAMDWARGARLEEGARCS